MADELPKQRRLAAIMFTDMVGYSAMSQRNETLALELLDEHRKLLRQSFARHDGREIEAVGDGFFVEFPSALAAAHCAAEIQRLLHERNLGQPSDRQVLVRIGIHLGDVVAQGDRVHGDGVNIAARIEPLAEPGGVRLSEDVARQIQNKIEFEVRKLGRADLKNIELPVDLYRLVLPWQASGRLAWRGFTRRDRLRRHAPIGIGAVLVGLVFVVVWALQRHTEPPATARRVAVLPFVSLSADQADEYFADGITEEMISQLSKIHGLEVIARTSVMTYKGKNKNIEDIGRELRVSTILKGSVRKAENNIRITAQLVDVNTQAHLWSRDYDRELKGVFSIQSEIARNVAEALKVELDASEKLRVDRKKTDRPEAYEAYLKGLYHFNKQTQEGFDKSVEYLEQAIAIDPGYADAYAGLALAYNIQGWYGLLPEQQAFQKAKTFASEALELEAANAVALAVMGDVTILDWDWVAAERYYRRALAANPNSAVSHESFGLQFLSAMGRHEEAIATLKRAVELDPLAAQYPDTLGWALLLARRYDEAIEQFQKTLQMEPSMAIAHRGLGESYAYKGMYDEAIAALRDAVESSDGSPFFLASLGWAYGVAGRTKEAHEVLGKLKEQDKQGLVSPSDFARVYLGLGDKDQALHWLERTYKERSGLWLLVWAKQFPFFDSLRTDARFKTLLEKTTTRLEVQSRRSPPTHTRSFCSRVLCRWPNCVRRRRRHCEQFPLRSLEG